MTETITGRMTSTRMEAAGYAANTERALCRLLNAAGLGSASVRLLDAVSGRPRVFIPNVAKAARSVVREHKERGVQTVRWRPNPFAAPKPHPEPIQAPPEPPPELPLHDTRARPDDQPATPHASQAGPP